MTDKYYIYIYKQEGNNKIKKLFNAVDCFQLQKSTVCSAKHFGFGALVRHVEQKLFQ